MGVRYKVRKDNGGKKGLYVVISNNDYAMYFFLNHLNCDIKSQSRIGTGLRSIY